MEGVRDEHSRRARSAVEEDIVEDRLANVSIKSGEGILDCGIVVLSAHGQGIQDTYIEYQNVGSRVNGATDVNTLLLTTRK
jgi:hypothetical protein